jgi:hypothetical protein
VSWAPRHAAVLVVGGLLAAACGGLSSESDAITAPSSSRVIEEYPDAITRHLDRLASAPRPVTNSAMPPRHLDTETFPVSLVDRSLIVSGGPPPDGIPPIDDPRFEVASEVDWIEPEEPVLVLLLDGEERAYPIQVMIWHEVVNDVVAGHPVTATYCPLCNSGVVFNRQVGDNVLDFGTSGGLYQANLVLYDRQTETLWTQFDGRAVVGTLVGEQLATVPTSMVSWNDYLLDHPDGSVLSRDTRNPKPYGRNPYNAYDQRTAPVAGFFTGEPDKTLPPLERIVGISTTYEALAVPTDSLAKVGVASTTLGGRPITLWHLPGTASALNDADLASGEDVGSTGVFYAQVAGQPADFKRVERWFVDDVTESTWNILGEAIAGPERGARLESLDHVDTFWFSWATFRVDAVLYDPTAG